MHNHRAGQSQEKTGQFILPFHVFLPVSCTKLYSLTLSVPSSYFQSDCLTFCLTLAFSLSSLHLWCIPIYNVSVSLIYQVLSLSICLFVSLCVPVSVCFSFSVSSVTITPGIFLLWVICIYFVLLYIILIERRKSHVKYICLFWFALPVRILLFVFLSISC